MNLTRIDVKDIRAKLQQHKALGLHVDGRLLAEIERPGEMYTGFLSSQDQLLSLVGNQLMTFAPWQFQTLVDSGFKWFEKCVDVDIGFDFAKFGLVVLTPLVNSEKGETPGYALYI